MNITLKRTTEQLELIKAMASKNRTVAYEAQVALAEFIGPVISEVINNAPTLSNMFTTLQFNADDNPSIPLDLYYDVTDQDYIQVWSQSTPGGLPVNHVAPTASELKFSTYQLDSAVSFDKRYASRSRLDVVGKTFTRVAQEVLLKQERTSANLILGTLAEATTNGKTHAIHSATSNRFLLADLNALMTRSKRVNSSWDGGTPDSRGRGITDLVCSPEIVEEIRSMAYNPVNTRGGTGTADAAAGAGDVIAAPDSVREKLWGNAGIPEFYGVSIMEINELGIGQKFNAIFDTLAGTTAYDAPNGGTAGVFADGDEIVIGVDLVSGRDAMLRAVATDPDSNAEFSLTADDQYSIRQKKIGYFGSLEEGRMIVDNRVLFGVIV
jgi:hypothetical protein